MVETLALDIIPNCAKSKCMTMEEAGCCGMEQALLYADYPCLQRLEVDVRRGLIVGVRWGSTSLTDS